MNTKAATQQMCDSMVGSLSWIDSEPESELIAALKEFRQQLIDLPNTVVEGQPVVYPRDPRQRDNCC